MSGLEYYLPILLGTATLLPLASFALIVLFGPRMGKHGEMAGWVAVGAIGGACVLSLVAFCMWISAHPPAAAEHGSGHAWLQLDLASPANAQEPEGQPQGDGAAAAQEDAVANPAAGGAQAPAYAPPGQAAPGEGAGDHAAPADTAPGHAPAGHASGSTVPPIAGDWYELDPWIHPGAFPKISIGYYIDALTVTMFVMVTLIATCIHVYAMGYMHEELHDITDHEVTLSNGHHLHRPGRYHRFFQYLSLFSFSMLGLVVSGNIAMVFVFWELVGICSYFLIGFYIERKSACVAANKAFIVNRVGDFGMIIGLMALWGSLGTFAFGDTEDKDGRVIAQGIFSQVRPAEVGGQPNHHRLITPAGMVQAEIGAELMMALEEHPDPRDGRSEFESRVSIARSEGVGYGLLVLAGLGIFCGCVGKSAQFPLHVWLPDAMEGPTPVSALVHSATMVAAGVYLVGRFFPVFAPEVLLVIAIIGGSTLFIAATIAITAVDIKRVLAYSTVSQLGYMMLSLGVGGWVAGLFHLITHAFFKSLLFLCSGSVIHACHTNDMRKMGGLRKKMPITAYTMLIGCLAIAGAPFFSGFFSKDAIVAQLINFTQTSPDHPGAPEMAILFYVAAGGAAITAFYMFRLWYMTFAGQPRDHHIYDHAHESPRVMWAPLVVLAVFAIAAGWSVPFTNLSVTALLEQARPLGTADGAGVGMAWNWLTYRAERLSHEPAIHTQATAVASGTALIGFLLATLMYGKGLVNPEEVRRQFGAIYSFLWNKWWFDELYDNLFVKPTLFCSRLAAAIDRRLIDWFVDSTARWTVAVSKFDDIFIDRLLVDGLVNLTADWIRSGGYWLRNVQTGKLRQYVVFIVVGTVVLFVLISFWTQASAGR
jgi:NADH-quinone oxidoreductase subunit L